MDSKQHYFLVSCAVLCRESYYCAAISKNIIDVKILEQGLHDIGECKMSAKLQEELDAIAMEKYDAILFGYGLCNNGIRGLHSKIPLVIPRAHDCITLLMGSKEKYRKYFDDNPGTYYKSSGWIERAKNHLSNPASTTRKMGIATYEEYVEKYGEDNAKYLIETTGGGLEHYTKLAFIDTKVGDTNHYKAQQRESTKNKNWDFDDVEGNVDILLKMTNREWNDDEFLVIQPGDTVEPSHNDSIIKSIRKNAEQSPAADA